jgi:hypothetical protein
VTDASKIKRRAMAELREALDVPGQEAGARFLPQQWLGLERQLRRLPTWALVQLQMRIEFRADLSFEHGRHHPPPRAAAATTTNERTD